MLENRKISDVKRFTEKTYIFSRILQGNITVVRNCEKKIHKSIKDYKTDNGIAEVEFIKTGSHCPSLCSNRKTLRSCRISN